MPYVVPKMALCFDLPDAAAILYRFEAVNMVVEQNC